MKLSVEDSNLLSEPLIKWIKTFKYDVDGADFVNLSQLIGSGFLDNILYFIRNSKKSKVTNRESPITIAERLHNVRRLFDDILDFYQNEMKQVVMLKAPNLVRISESIYFDDCNEDVCGLLTLLLGCATQCARKKQLIERISQLLDESDQQEVQRCFELLADNSMAADRSSLELDDNLAHMHDQVTALSGERLIYMKKYYDCFEKHSSTCLGEQEDNKMHVPILIRTVVPVDHGGQWELASARKLTSGTADRREDDVLIVRYRPTVRFSGAGAPGGLSEVDKQKLRDADKKQKENEKLEEQVQDLEQQLHDFEFHKKRVKDLHTDNSKLIMDKQRLQDQLASSRKKEEDVIERLVDCQMKLDEAHMEREMDRKKITELMQQGAHKNTNDDHSESEMETGPTDKKAMKKKFQEYEREIEALKTRLMEAQKQDNQTDDKWKFLEVQKEKVDARRQLNESNKDNEELRQTVGRLELKVEHLDKELLEAQDTADISRSASDDHASQLEQRIQELARQIALLRKKGGQLTGGSELEQKELELMLETVQELTTEVGRLKAHNKVLRQTCDKLKRDVGRVTAMETESARLQQENRALRQQQATQQGSAEGDDELRRANLALQVENRKLRRMIDTLRYMLIQVDPQNRHKYTYITSF